MVRSASRYVLVTITAVLSLAGCGDGITDPGSGGTTSAFSTTGIAAAGRAGHIAVALPNGRVLVAGGTNGSTHLASAELFDPATHSWSAAAGMAYPRLGHAAVSLSDGRVLVVGGHSVLSACATTPVSRSAEIYDPASGAWTPAAHMIAPRNSPAAVLLADGRVLVAGGGDRCGGVFRSAEIYNPATGTWATTGALNVPRQAAAPVRLSDGRVLVAGGVGSSPTWPALASAEIYDPATGTWTLTGNMNGARLWGSVDVSASEVLALLADGRVLAAGGFDSCWQVCGFVLQSSAEVFDPATRAWTPVGSLSVARSNHRLSRLPTGHVLVAGGQAGSAVLGDAEVFDPASGTFVSAGALVTARYDHSATRLADGRVLIAQGQGPSGVLTSAEIFAVNRAPVAYAGAAVSGDEGAEFAFSAAGSSDPDGDALTYSWDFGDGSAPVSGLNGRHVYADNGRYTVTLTVSDGSYSSTATTTATVENVAPVVGALADGELLPGQTYAVSGSFADPGADNWSATVDYGDGSGVQPLALSGQSFSLNHRFLATGSFAVTVTVSDDEGGSGSAEFTVTVMMPQQQLAAMIARLEALADGGVLLAQDARTLSSKLSVAMAHLDGGKTEPALNQLSAFIVMVQARVAAGRISPAVGGELISEARQLMAAIAAL